MDEIKLKLLENYSEENLVCSLSVYQGLNPFENLYFWNTICKILNEENVVVILGFVFELQENAIIFPRYAQKSLNFHIHQINKKIAKLVPRQFAFYVKTLKLFKFAKEPAFIEISENSFDCHEYLINVVYDILIRTSTIEISNLIDKHFKIKHNDVEIDISKRLLEWMVKIDENNKAVYIKYMCYTLNNSITVLEYIYGNTDSPDIKLLFEFIYLLNKDLYNDIVQAVYDNLKYQKVDILKLLPEIEIDKLLLGDEHIELFKYFLVYKPIYKEILIEILSKNLNRKNILQIFSEFYDILKDIAFDFNFNELMEISANNSLALYKAFSLIQTDEQKSIFYSKFTNVDDEFIIDFLKIYSDENLVFHILSTRQLKDNLKKFIIENYKTQKNLIYKMFIYMEKEDVKNYIVSHLVDLSSLGYFLLSMNPTEILINSLNLTNIKVGIKVIDLCVESSDFQEDDFKNALNEVKNLMPPLVIRTLILSYKKYPHLKNFTINYLCDMVNRQAMKSEQLCTGIVRCMEIVGPDCVHVMTYMNDDDLIRVFEKSTTARKFCLDVLYRKENRYKKDLEKLRRFFSRRY